MRVENVENKSVFNNFHGVFNILDAKIEK